MAYATVEQLADLLGRSAPPNAAVLLDRASRDIDRALVTAVYDSTDATIIAALKNATLEQVAWRLEVGDVNGIRHDAQSGVPTPVPVTVSLSRYGNAVGADTSKTQILGEQAYAVLQAAGLTAWGPIPT